jgi:lipopolysaccharide transport system permease protein
VLFALAYFLIFGFVFEPKLPAGVGRADGKLAFAFFLLAGLLPWMAFAEAIVAGAASVAGNADLLRKTALPPILFPLQAVSVTAVIYSVPIAILMLVAMINGLGSWKSMLFIPVWFGMQCVVMLLIAVALGMMVAAFRDVEQLVGLAVGVGLFFAPIFYAAEYAPVMLKSLIWTNPYTPFANGFHALILRGELPVLRDVGAVVAWLAGSAAVAGSLYRRGRDQVVDWL